MLLKKKSFKKNEQNQLIIDIISLSKDKDNYKIEKKRSINGKIISGSLTKRSKYNIANFNYELECRMKSN